MPHLRSRSTSPTGATVLLVGLSAAAAVLSACGGGGQANAAATTGTTTAPNGQGGQGGQRGGQGGAGTARFPGASGLVAEVDGKTLQVQGTGTQTAVTWTGATRFTREVTVTRAAVRPGACVVVRSQPTAQSGTPSDPSTATAQSVAISQPVSGRCEAGFGRGGAGRGGFPGGQPPRTAQAGQGQPTGLPTGGAGRARGSGGIGGAFGTVTAVSATGFTVQSTVPVRPPGTASASPTTSTATQTRVVTVTTTSTTTYTSTVAATASAAKVGTCVTALGQTDTTGAVAATSIAVRPAENGTCSTGFGRPTGQGTATTHG